MAAILKTFTDGSALSASDVNTYLQRQAVIQCASSTRPGSPQVGMTIWETDTGNCKQYQSATTGWTAPWNTAWGIVGGAAVGYGQSTADQTSIGTGGANITGMICTFTAIATRYYRITATVGEIQANGTLRCFAAVTDGSSTILQAQSSMLNTDIFSPSLSFVQTGLSGSTIRRVNVHTTASNVDVGGSTYPGQIMVEDIGPSAAPA